MLLVKLFICLYGQLRIAHKCKNIYFFRHNNLNSFVTISNKLAHINIYHRFISRKRYFMILRVRKFIKHLDLADINNMCLNIIITLFIRVKIRPSCSKKVRMIKFVVYCTCVKLHCYKNGQIYHRCFMYCHIFKRTSIYMQQVSKLF